MTPTNPSKSDPSIPAEGVTIKDTAKGVEYKVITAGKVAYAKTTSTSTTVAVPATVKIDGITYQVTSIAANAFKNNKKIKRVTIGKNVQVIGAKAFYGCKKLSSVTIPSKVKTIDKKAFYGCKKLKKITIKSKLLTSKRVGSKAFQGIYSKVAITVPKSKYKAYKTLLKAKGVGTKAKYKKK